MFGRIVRVLAWTAAGVVLIAGALYAFRGPLFGGRVARAIGELLSKELGVPVTVEAVEGNYVTEIRLIGMRAAPGTSLARLEIAKTSIWYPFLGVLRADPLRVIRSVEVSGADVEVDTTGPAAPRGPFRFRDLPSIGARIAASGKIAVRVRDGVVRADRFELSGTGGRFELLLDPLALPEAWRIEPARIEATFDRTAPNALAWTSPSELAGVALRRLNLVEVEAGRFELGYDVGIGGGRAAGKVAASSIAFELERVDFEKIPAWIRGLLNDPDVIPSKAVLAASGSLDQWSGPERALRAQIDAAAVTWAGVAAESLKAAGGWTGRRISVASAKAAIGGTPVDGEDLVFDLDDDLVIVAARSITARGPDAAPFASALGLRSEPGRIPPGIPFEVRVRRPEGAPVAVERVVAEAGGFAAEASGSVAVHGRWRDWKTFELDLATKIRSKDGAATSRRQGVEVAAAELAVEGRLRGALGRPTGELTLTASKARIGTLEIDRATASGTVDWPSITIARFEAVFGEDVATASGKIDAERLEAKDVSFEVKLARLATLKRVFPDLPNLFGRASATGVIRRAAAGEIALEATVAGQSVRVGKLELGAVDGKLRVENDRLGLDALKIASPYANVEMSGSATLADPTAAAADLRFTARVTEISTLGDFWSGFKRARGSARVDGRVVKAAGAPLSGGALTTKVVASALAIDAWRIGAASADLKLAWPRLTVEGLDARGPSGQARGAATLDLESGTITTLALDLDGTVETGALALGPGAPSLAGKVRVQGRIEKVPGEGWQALRGNLEISADQLVVAGREIAEVHARVAASDGELRVEEIAGAHAGADVSASGVVRPAGGGVDVEIQTFAADWERGWSVALGKPVGIRWRPESVEVGAFTLRGAGGTLSGSARIGESLAVSLEARALQIGMAWPAAAGSVDLDLTASGSFDAPVFKGDVRLSDLEYQGQKGRIEAAFRQEGGRLDVERLDIDAGELLKLEGSGRFPPVSLRGGRPAFGSLADAAFRLRGHTSGAEAWKRLGVRAPSRLSDLALDVEARGPVLTVTSTARLLVRRARDDEAAGEVPVELTGCVGPEGAKLDVRAGEAGAPLATARVFSSRSYDWTRLAEAFEQGGDLPLGGSLDADLADSAPLAPFFPELRHLGGSLKVHADLAGTLAKPELTGSAQLDAFSIRFEADVPGVDDVVARIRLQGRDLVIEKLEGKTGYSPFAVSGQATLASLRRPVLDVAIKGTNVLIARDEDLRLRADLDTTLKGPLDALEVRGRARVTDALWSQPMDLGGGTPGGNPRPAGTNTKEGGQAVFRFRDPPFSTATLDVEIVSDHTTRVENNLVKALVSAQLHLVGSGEAPRIEGRIATDRASVRLPFTRLEVERAEINFRPEDQYRARLDAVATTRIKGTQLTVHVSGLLPDTDVKVASLPPLSQRDAYLLLTTGITPGELQREGIAGAALYRAGSVYGTELLSQFSSASDENALDRFALEIGKDQSVDGRPTVDVEAPLSERFYLHGQRDRFDDYNAGIIWRLRFR